jgi:hypothetical protein
LLAAAARPERETRRVDRNMVNTRDNKGPVAFRERGLKVSLSVKAKYQLKFVGQVHLL